MFPKLKEKADKWVKAKVVKSCRLKAAKKGWSNKGCLSLPYLFDNPPRQNAKWNLKEDSDLIARRAEGTTISQLSFMHFRKFNAIEIRLSRLGVS